MENEIDLSEAILFSDASRGIYIPQHFAREIKPGNLSEGVDVHDLETLKAGPDHDQYWDVWNHMLDNAVIVDEKTGVRYHMHQDGDLWLVPLSDTPDDDAAAREPFTVICNPGMVACGDRNRRAFVKIHFDGRKLSISGVVGPRPNGDAESCGQIVSELRGLAKLDDAWTESMVDRLAKFWHDWHMNDTRAYSPAMKKAGWREKAATPAWIYEYTLTRDAMKAKRDAETAASEALKAGETFKPTVQQTAAASMPYSLKIVTTKATPDGEPIEPTPPSNSYERAKHIGGHMSGSVKGPERETLGWITPKEHKDGLLTRKLHDSDSHGYGQKWWFEPVPVDVLAYLRRLPKTTVKPAWI